MRILSLNGSDTSDVNGVRVGNISSKICVFAHGQCMKRVICEYSGVTELLGALRKFSFGGPRHLLSINIYFKTLISVVFS